MEQPDLTGLEAPQPGAELPENPEQTSSQDDADASGASGNQPAETEEQRQARASEAARTLNQRRAENRENAARRLQEDRDAWRTLAQSLAQGRGQQQAPPQEIPEAPREPTMDFDPATGKPFTSYETYLERRAEYIAEQRVHQALTQRLQAAVHQSNAQRMAQEAHMVNRQMEQRNREFAKAVPDFEEVTNQDIEIPGPATEAIKRLQNGPAVVYVLGKNPELAYELQQRGPVEQVVMVGQLSSWIAANSQKQISQSAPAGRGVGGRPSPSDTPPEDTEEYVKWANKKFGKR